MHRSATFIGYLLIATLAGMAMMLIFFWQAGADLSQSSFVADSRVVEKIIGMKPGDKIRQSDLQAGDKILKINGIEVKNWREAYLVMQAIYQPAGEVVFFEVTREDSEGRRSKLEKPVELERVAVSDVILKGAPRNKRPSTDKFNPTAEDLFSAARSGNASAVAQIIEANLALVEDDKAEPIIDSLVNDADSIGAAQTALIAAVDRGHVGVAKVLIEKKANPNKAAADGTTALMKAAERGNRELVVMMLASGADPRQRNAELKTAADIADGNDFVDIAMLIDNPRPTAFLPSDQRRKVPDLLSQQGLLSVKDRRPSEDVLSRAIKQWQLRNGMPASGILTPDQFPKLEKTTKDWVSKYSEGQASQETKKTFARMSTTFFSRDWAPVSSVNGYPNCAAEFVLFELSPDQSEITWKTYRDVTPADIQAGAEPAQESSYKVLKAENQDGYDVIEVKAHPQPSSGLAFQVWEIRDGQMKITLKEKRDSEETVRGAYLSRCR